MQNSASCVLHLVDERKEKESFLIELEENINIISIEVSK